MLRQPKALPQLPNPINCTIRDLVESVRAHEAIYADVSPPSTLKSFLGSMFCCLGPVAES